MKTVMNTAGRDRSMIDSQDSLLDKKEGETIVHETIPGDKEHPSAQEKKRMLDDDGAAVSTTDEDLN